MKKIILTFVFSIVSIVCFAQSAFDKYDGQDGVTSILVNKKMFQMMASVKVDANDKETQQYLNLIKKLDNLKVFTTTSSKISADMKSTAEIYNKTAGLEEFMKVNNGSENIKVWVKSGDSNQIKELLMVGKEVNNANKMVLMSLTGDFTMDDISILTDKMKIPGGAELKKATKK
ncbi:DUF4252 domain-containing protein [Flavobacterium sp.]|jgi:hypothetical protein|uniref:DUF4252 domain-containing protein n=1 Tax=Flavobacterium sp. TaxID=239 RepID=UPI0037C0FF88